MSNNVLGFLKDKGIKHVQKGPDLYVSCFNKRDHKRGDINPSLGVDGDTGVFYCWSCHVRGTFPQLIAAYGYVGEVSQYSEYKSKRRIVYDIDSLKGNGGINIPGIGKFMEKVKDYSLENSREYLESRKISLSEDERQLSDRIISAEYARGDRLSYIEKIDSINLEGISIPESLHRVSYIEYFSERGLPSNFCEHTEVYLAPKYVEIPQYKSFVSPKYFYIPVRGVTNNIRTIMGVSFNKTEVPRMYHVGPKISYPLLDLNKIRYDDDLYIVEGWLDHYKLQVMGYNSFPTLSNVFNFFHYTLVNQIPPDKRVFFVFDQDVAGYHMMKDILKFTSRSTKNWYAVFLPHHKYKDVGDIELLDIPLELGSAKVISLYQIKKYMILLGAEKYNGSKEILNSDRYSFRSDSIYQEFGTEHSGSGDEDLIEEGPRIWEELPVEKKRENEFGGPGRLVSI